MWDSSWLHDITLFEHSSHQASDFESLLDLEAVAASLFEENIHYESVQSELQSSCSDQVS